MRAVLRDQGTALRPLFGAETGDVDQQPVERAALESDVLVALDRLRLGVVRIRAVDTRLRRHAAIVAQSRAQKATCR
ncbi:hypothetical protein [Streptomyces sp. CBMA152]|uniref:hypothetical protein n=1 Tax=Streptomyces sp. CBMA152 TaxID=1896312 RepID=UPI001660A8DA|nr:hypothetical protein [Streptomyces sp. CBMA152]